MSWPSVELGDICKPKQHKTVPSSELLDEGFVVYGANGPIGHYSEFTHDRTTIAITCRGATCGTINVVPPKSYITGNAMALDDLDENRVELKFLRYSLEHQGFKGVINGAAQPQITRGPLLTYKIPLPPLEEQRRIAGILDQADALRRLRTRALDKLNTLGQAIFHEMFGDTTSNSLDWPVVEVGAITNCIVPGRDKPKSFTGDTPWITTAELNHLGVTTASNAKLGLSNEEIAEVRARLIPKSSVVITCVGDLGVASIAGCEMVINQQLHSFQCGEEVVPSYLMRALAHQKNWMLRRATQTTLPYMNKSVCNAIPVPLPPTRLQKEFAARMTVLEEPFAAGSTANHHLEALFHSLQARAFRGEI